MRSVTSMTSAWESGDRDNPVARWELRIGKYRVFYEVYENTSTVAVGAVGFKVHNVLYIRGEEVEL